MLEFQVINVQRHAHETETLSKLWTLSRQILVRTSGPVFTNVQLEFAKVRRRVVMLNLELLIEFSDY